MENNIKETYFDPFTLNIHISGNQAMTTIAMMNHMKIMQYQK